MSGEIAQEPMAAGAFEVASAQRNSTLQGKGRQLGFPSSFSAPKNSEYFLHIWLKFTVSSVI